ncbi:MAG: SUMF1/EgtB/PvdO family nonheme iron enzyme, partial [Alloprevotella sp.]
GTATARVAFGKYDYRVDASGYHPEVGRLQVSDPENKVIKQIALLPAFGYLEVKSNSTLQGAKVLVDDALVGTVPCRSARLASGRHNLKIVRPLYAPLEQTIEIADGQTLELSPQLSADFARLTLQTAAEADIYVNGEKKGRGAWTGELGSGTYLLECRQANHRSTRRELAVTAELSGQTIRLDAPTAITTSLEINSTPAMADIYIDSKNVGQTPLFLAKQAVGSHRLRISKSGYADYTAELSLQQNEPATVHATLKAGAAPAAAAGNAAGPAASSGSGQREFTVKGVKFTMRLVEAGTFQMGCTPEQENPDPDEKVHTVTLTRDYYLGATEVTQALWEAVMGKNPSYFKGSNRPVEQVSWKDCQKFIKALNRATGEQFRLPTEAEWEYAARGGGKSRGTQYSGSAKIGDVAWYTKNAGGTTHDVGTKQANELGLYDMSGNVWEWCQDWSGSYPAGSVTDPAGPTTGSYRVRRGGSWCRIAGHCRSARRDWFEPGGRDSDLGLRLCLPVLKK